MQNLVKRTKRQPRKSRSAVRESFPLIIQSISPECLQRDADPRLLSAAISDALLEHFKNVLMHESRRLSASDLAVLAAWSPSELGGYILRAASGESEAPKPPVLQILSKFVLAQAETPLSWRIRESVHVKALLRIWERFDEGPEFLERLGRAEAIGMRVGQRKQFPRIFSPLEYVVKQSAVEQMDAIHPRLRNAFPDAQATSSAELLQWVTKEVKTSAAYPVLRWCSEHEAEYGPLYTRQTIKSLLMPEHSPSSADIWDSYRAKQTGHSEDHLRKLISSHRSFPQLI